MECLDENALVGFAEGGLSEAARAGIEAHIDGCSACRELVLHDPAPATLRRAAAPLEVGTMVADRYRLDRVVGEGGLGVVWAATHLFTRKPEPRHPENRATSRARSRAARRARLVRGPHAVARARPASFGSERHPSAAPGAMSTFRVVALSLLASGCLDGALHPPSTDAGAVPGAWSTGVPLPAERFEALAAVSGGRIYYLGGITGIFGDMRSARASDRVDIFDPAASVWSVGPSLPPDSAKHHLAVAVLAGKIYVLGGFVGIIGGSDPQGKFLPNGVTYVLEGATWRRLADQPIARGSATAQGINGKIYVAGGGLTEPDAMADLYEYDPLTDTWAKKAPMPTAREHVTSCAVRGKLIVLGGWRGAEKSTVSSAERYDPASDTWERLPDMPTARGGLGAATLGDTCFAVGGERWTGDEPGTYGNVEGLSSTDQWSAYAGMPTARHGLGLVAVGSSLYAVGGGPVRGNSYTRVVEIFRP